MLCHDTMNNSSVKVILQQGQGFKVLPQGSCWSGQHAKKLMSLYRHEWHHNRCSLSFQDPDHSRGSECLGESMNHIAPPQNTYHRLEILLYCTVLYCTVLCYPCLVSVKHSYRKLQYSYCDPFHQHTLFPYTSN